MSDPQRPLHEIVQRYPDVRAALVDLVTGVDKLHAAVEQLRTGVKQLQAAHDVQRDDDVTE